MGGLQRRKVKQLGEDFGSSVRSGVMVSDMAWVVEELLLNSLDAGAINACVYVNAGSCFVKVVDDGCGISRDGLSLLGKRYVTSKHQSESLTTGNISGSRGESLASISDVATVEIATKALGTPIGYRKLLKGSKCLYLGIDSDRKEAGTTVIVRDLFYNQPVRRKGLLSSPQKVLQSVKLCVFQLALVRQDINFQVVDSEREEQLLNTHSYSAFSVLLNGYGIKNSSFLHQLTFTDGILKISGRISNPIHEFHTMVFQYIYVNSRYVCKGRIHQLLSFLAGRSFMYKEWNSDNVCRKGKRKKIIASPSYILNITCPASLYYLTFEPSKATVHFEDWSLILHFIERAVDQIWKIDDCQVDIPDSPLPNQVHETFPERCFDLPQDSSKWFDVQLTNGDEDSNLMNPEFVEYFLPTDEIEGKCTTSGKPILPDSPINRDYSCKRSKRKYLEDLDFAHQVSYKRHESGLRSSEMPLDILEFGFYGKNVDSLQDCSLGKCIPVGGFNFYSDEVLCNRRDNMPILNNVSSYAWHGIPSEDQNNLYNIIGYQKGKLPRAIADYSGEKFPWDKDTISDSPIYYDRLDNDFCKLFDEPSANTRLSLDGIDLFIKPEFSHGWTNDEEYTDLQDMSVSKKARRSHSAPPFLRYKKKFVTLTDVSVPMKHAGELTRDELLPADYETDEIRYMERLPTNPTYSVALNRRQDNVDKENTDKAERGEMSVKRMDSVTELHNCSNHLGVETEPPILDICTGLLHLSASKLVPTSSSKRLLNDAKVLQQVDRKFIPIVADHIISLIDQHAADERIRLEELREKILDGEERKITRLPREQQLMLPEYGFQSLHNFHQQITDWGWICNIQSSSESFNKSIHILHKEPTLPTLAAVPTILGVNLSDADLLEFLNQLTETEGSSTVPPSVNRILASKACRGAIMFGDRLLQSECSLLVHELKKTSFWFQCAHGRPTTVPLVSLSALHEHLDDLNSSSAVFHGLKRHRIALDRAAHRLSVANFTS